MKPLTATEIKDGWVKGCSCGKCKYCYVSESIKIKQEAIFTPLIKRVKALLKKRGKEIPTFVYHPGDLSKAFEEFCIEGEISKERLHKLGIE